MKKIKVGVIYGGRSAEHAVSLISAAAVMQNLDQTQFEIIPIGVDLQGTWWRNDFDNLFEANRQSCKVKTENAAALSAPQFDLAEQVDVVFPMIHGPLGEDGALQGFLTFFNIPFVGAGVLGSAVAMDKSLSKILAEKSNIPVLPAITIHKHEFLADPDAVAACVAQTLKYPVFVKAVDLGSSVGTERVGDPKDLLAACKRTLDLTEKLIIEQGLPHAHEIELAVLESAEYGQIPMVSIAGEVLYDKRDGFYSYAAKYVHTDGIQLEIPADITTEQMEAAQDMAIQLFYRLDLSGMARIDLLLDRETGKLYFNEANTIPGFTAVSMYPKLCDSSGVTYPKLLTQLIDLALARHERLNNLQRYTTESKN